MPKSRAQARPIMTSTRAKRRKSFKPSGKDALFDELLNEPSKRKRIRATSPQVDEEVTTEETKEEAFIKEEKQAEEEKIVTDSDPCSNLLVPSTTVNAIREEKGDNNESVPQEEAVSPQVPSPNSPIFPNVTDTEEAVVDQVENAFDIEEDKEEENEEESECLIVEEAKASDWVSSSFLNSTDSIMVINNQGTEIEEESSVETHPKDSQVWFSYIFTI